MTQLLETVFVALAFPVMMLGAQRVAHGGKVGVNPLAAFTLAWWLAGCLHLLNPLGVIGLPFEAELAVAGSIVCFTLGYIVPCRLAHSSVRDDCAGGVDTATLYPLGNLLRVALVFGGLLFVVFVNEIGLSQLLGDPAAVLLSTRLALNSGSIPAGFYFFYFFELAVPVAVVLWYFRRRRRYLVFAVLAGVALITTTGRTNVFTAIVWLTFTLLIMRGPARINRNQVLGGGAAALLALAVFVVVGEALGKNFSNSALSDVVTGSSPVLNALIIPLFYLAGLLPTFGAIVGDPSTVTGAGLTFRPFLQVLHLLDHSIDVPSKLEQFYLIPTPFNLATYLAPFWHDGGMIWVLAGSALTGFACGVAFSFWRRERRPASLLLAGFFTLVALNTIKDSSLNEISAILQIGLLVLCAQAERSRRNADKCDSGGHVVRSSSTRRRAN